MMTTSHLFSRALSDSYILFGHSGKILTPKSNHSFEDSQDIDLSGLHVIYNSRTLNTSKKSTDNIER